MGRFEPRLTEGGADPEQAVARMFRERVAARREGRLLYQVAAAYDAGSLVPVDRAFLESLVGVGAWTRELTDDISRELETGELREFRYSPSTGSVWSTDLIDSEIEGGTGGWLLAWEHTSTGLMHLRSVSVSHGDAAR